MKPKIAVVDLDDTICYPNHQFKDTYRRYKLASPNPQMVKALIAWKAAGNKIIIHTARRMLTHKGDLAKIEADVGQVTRDWLKMHKVSYNKLIFGKPYGDVYVDDKNCSIRSFIRA
jgi:capsule biosynthesis phosphatase